MSRSPTSDFSFLERSFVFCPIHQRTSLERSSKVLSPEGLHLHRFQAISGWGGTPKALFCSLAHRPGMSEEEEEKLRERKWLFEATGNAVKAISDDGCALERSLFALSKEREQLLLSVAECSSMTLPCQSRAHSNMAKCGKTSHLQVFPCH